MKQQQGSVIWCGTSFPTRLGSSYPDFVAPLFAVENDFLFWTGTRKQNELANSALLLLVLVSAAPCLNFVPSMSSVRVCVTVT